ncbi:enterotoxin [Dokdonella soli]|uniref:Enterotoxin n=1 Tax=Dokdonella soli TaxID=529810 RepID=A0ABN1IHH9_9GAMM
MNRFLFFSAAFAAAAALVSVDVMAGTSPAATLPAPWLPSDPGAAHCRTDASHAELTNGALRFGVAINGKSVRPAEFDNAFAAARHALNGELFSVLPRGGKKLDASNFRLDGALRCNRIAAAPGAARAAERRAGIALDARFTDPGSGLKVRWRALLRDGSNYVRESLTFESNATIDLASVTLIDLDLEAAWVDGTADGSPLIADDRFFGFEHPMAQARAINGRATASLKRVLPLRGGVATEYSAVLGVAPHGQLRRGFQAYLENERAAPFHTFLHYNSWYDIGYFTPYTEAEAVNVIDAYGKQLVQDRGVKMDSFLFDDGWDDHAHLWQFSKDFPHGFTPVREAAGKFGAEPGVWLSPWGGYGPPREERLATAKAGGYEVDDQGIALSGRKYYPLFHDAALNLLKRYGINQFKLDGTGSPDKVTPGSEFDSDFAAAIALINDLRAVKPDLFINLTTGTWPSPFWLRTADSIWRGGEDHSFAGVGSDRQRWITYRDADTYGGIVRQGPMFPLNSLMLHGIIYARKAQGLNADPHNDFADEVRSYFAGGTGLQEMYVSPDLLTAQNWDDLAAAAKWARERAAVLRDSHWIGGDPARLQVYGWASWAPGRAVVALRNPGDQPQEFALDVEHALELPQGATRDWIATPVYTLGAPQPLHAGQATPLKLQPFEVRVWDLAPALRK